MSIGKKGTDNSRFLEAAKRYTENADGGTDNSRFLEAAKRYTGNAELTHTPTIGELLKASAPVNQPQPQPSFALELRKAEEQARQENSTAANQTIKEQSRPSPSRNATFADNAKSLGHDVVTGLAGASNALWHFADWIIPDEAVSQIFGVENKVGQFFDKQDATYDAIRQKNKELGQKADKAVEVIGDYVVQPVAAAVPQAAVAVMSGGTSLAEQGVSALGTAASTSGTVAMLGSAVKNMMSNPSFWMSFAQTAGNTYNDAKESGASELEAQAATLLNAFGGSSIEIGGGIQTLPGTDMGLRSWIRSTLEEGGEEYLQGIMEQLVTKAIYEQDKEWASWTDPDAIFSGSRALQEIVGGITVGGIVGSGQIGVGKAVQKVKDYSFAVKTGNQYINAKNGHSIEEAIRIGLSNPKGTDIYQAAETLAKKAQNGERISPYVVGRMVLENYSPKAEQARQIDQMVRDSAVQTGVNAETAQAVGAVAARFGRNIRFVSPEELRVGSETQDDVGTDTQAAQDAVFTGGRYFDGEILLSSALTVDKAIEFVLKHELVHSVETTKQWEQLADIVQAQMGDEQWSQALEETLERYGAQQGDFTLPQAEREVVADWIGKNLYKSGFAKVIVNGDATIGNAFVRTIDRLRLALGTKKSRSHTNLTVVERLFLRALENKASSSEGGYAQYALVGREHMQGDVAAEEELLMRAMEGDAAQENKTEHAQSWQRLSKEFVERTMARYGITALNDYVAVQKNVFDTLMQSGFFTDKESRSRVDTNKQSGMVIETNKSSIDETFNYNNYKACSAFKKVVKLATVEMLPDIIRNGELVDDNVPDKHRNAHNKKFAYIQQSVEVDGVPLIVKLAIKKSAVKNKLWVHYIEIKNDASSTSEVPKMAATLIKETGINNTITQSNPYVNTQFAQDGAEHAQTAEKPQYALISQEMLEDGKGEVDSQEYSEQAMSEALERVREARRAGTEKSRREADSELARRIADREISAEVGAREITAGRKASVEDNDKKWRTGNRGPRDAKEMAKEANRQYRENSREEKRKTELRQTAVRLRDELYNALEGPTKKKHIPPPMIPDVVSLLEAVYEDPAQIEENIKSLKKQRENTVNPVRIDDLDKKINANRRKFQSVSENLDRIRSQYKKCENDETYHGAYDERFAGYLQRVQVLMEGKGVRDLDSKELTQLVDILRAVGKQVLEYNRLRSEAFNKEAAQTADEWIQQIKKTETNDGALHVTIGNLNRWQLTPERFFNDTCGWVKDNVGAVIAAAAAEGESRRLKTMRLFGELFYEFANKKEYGRLTSINQKDLVDIGLVDEEGAAIYLSRGLMLGLYNHLICPGNRQALLDAGLHVPNLKEYYAGRVVHAYDRGSQRITVSGLTKQIHAALHKADEAETKQEFDEAYRQLTELTERANQDVDRLLDAIEEHMTDYERKLMHTVREWFDKVSKERINEVTMDVWGYESARVERYYPIHRNTDFVNKPIDSLVSDHSLEGSGFLKSRVRSKAPVLLTDISAELENSCEAVSRLYGFLPFTSDFQKIYNGYSADHKDSVKSVIANNYGKGKTIVGVTGQQYIENFLEDIAGAKKSDSTVLTPLRRYYVRATMSVNLRVAVSQLSALPTAGAELGWEYVAKAVKHIGKISPDERALMLKYSEYLYERSRGAGGTEEIHLAKEGSNPIDKIYNWIDKRTKGKLFGWCQAVDVKTVSTLWFGCKEKIKDTRPDLEVGSDAYYEAVGQELNRVIRKTQANYTVTDMSDLMRNKSEMLKFLTMFKADANQSYNILYESTMRLKKYKADYDAGINGVTAEDVKAAKSALVSAYTSVLAGSAIAFALLRALINFLTHNVNGYRNKEGEITGESVASRVGQEMLSSVAGMFVFGDVVYEVLESRVFGENYYGVSDMGMQALSDVLENLATGNYTTAKGWMYLTEDLCNVLGVPFRNVKNLVNGFRYHIEDIANGEFLSMNAGYSVADSVYYSRLHKAIAKGDEEKAEALRQYLLSTGKTETQINSGLRAVLKKSDKQVQKEAERFLKDVLENALYDQLNEKEKRKVESGLLGYLADKKLQTESGDDMTKAHQKAETMIKKGVSPSDYFLMQVVKNAMFVDEDEDGEVSKEEYRQVLDETDYEEHIKKLLLSIKR